MKHDQKVELFCLINDDSNYLSEDGIVGPANLELSKKLKEFGFKQKINRWWMDIDDVPYIEKGLHTSNKKEAFINHNKYDNFYSAPTKQQLLDWINKK